MLIQTEYPFFDIQFALAVKKHAPEVWRKGGNIYGNTAFQNGLKLYRREITPGVIRWLRKREAWAARHYQNFRLPGVVAQMKWLVIGRLGEQRMKAMIRDAVQQVRR